MCWDICKGHIVLNGYLCNVYFIASIKKEQNSLFYSAFSGHRKDHKISSSCVIQGFDTIPVISGKGNSENSGAVNWFG